MDILHTHIHTHTHANTHMGMPHTLTHRPILIYTHSHTYTQRHRHTRTHTHTQRHTHRHRHTLTYTITQTHMHIKFLNPCYAGQAFCCDKAEQGRSRRRRCILAQGCRGHLALGVSGHRSNTLHQGKEGMRRKAAHLAAARRQRAPRRRLEKDEHTEGRPPTVHVLQPGPTSSQHIPSYAYVNV